MTIMGRANPGPSPRASHIVETMVVDSFTDPGKRFDYVVEVIRSDIAWDVVVSFSSPKDRIELLREIAEVVRRSDEPSPISFYISKSDEDLEHYLDSLELMEGLDSEVRAFTILLRLDSFNPHANDLAKNLLLAQSHVNYWRLKTFNSSDDRLMYLDPLKSQWGYRVWKTLMELPISKKIVSHCGEEDYRDLLVFFTHFVEVFHAKKKTSRKVGALLKSSKTRALPGFVRGAFIDFPIEFPEFRAYLKTLTLGDLIFLRAAIEWDSPTAKSSVGICEGLIEGARLDMSFPAMSATLRAIDGAIARPLEAFAVRSYTHLCHTHLSRLESFALLEDYFLNLEEKVSVVTAHEVVSSVFAYTQVWTSHYSTADYIVGELFRTTGSSKETIDILKEVTHRGLTPSLRMWEEYVENWEVVKDVSPVLAFAVLEAE